jgi:hypothetical protein
MTLWGRENLNVISDKCHTQVMCVCIITHILHSVIKTYIALNLQSSKKICVVYSLSILVFGFFVILKSFSLKGLSWSLGRNHSAVKCETAGEVNVLGR